MDWTFLTSEVILISAHAQNLKKQFGGTRHDMAPRKKSPDPNPAPPAASQAPHEVIAVRAYEFFVQRGYAHGSDLQDWFQAESEMLAGQPTMPAESAEEPVKTPRRRKSPATKAAAS